jgi:RNA polymerase sigma factor (sigma-70 family)
MEAMNEPIDNLDLAWLGRLARALLGESQAADLVQDTVAATIERPMPEGVPRRAWLATIARRLAARRRRSECRRRDRERRSARSEVWDDETDLLERAEAIERVTTAARNLPEPFRHTILLRYLADLEPAEIAEREGRRVDTIRWRIRRGLELLRRELGDGEDSWRPMALLLLPLTPATPGVELAATGASAKSLGSTILGVATMKPLVALSLVIFCLGFWLYLESDEAPASLEGEISPSSTAISSAPRRASHRGPEARIETRPEAKEAPATTTERVRPRSGGRVVDTAGRGIAGATVFIATGDSPSPPGATTDARGYFALASDKALDLGVAANGFLRAFAPRFDVSSVGDIVLRRGATLTGRVLSPAGEPVPGLELLAHTPGPTIAHVSPSQMRRRARLAALGSQDTPFEGSRGRTNTAGVVELTGLPEGEVRVRCLDPSWTIEGPTTCEAGGPPLEWTARPRCGVRVEVSAPPGESPIGNVSAVFRVEIELANGTTENYEQWLGRGDGSVSFGLDASLLPRLAEVEVRRVTFHGSVRAGRLRADWRAASLDYAAEGPQCALVLVTLDPEAESPVEAANEEDVTTVETTTLRLEVRYSDGTPVTDRITLRWRGKDVPDGVARPRVDTPGVFLAQVPATELDLEVKEFAASGSLAPWRARLRLSAGLVKTQEVVLKRGGTLIIQRPSDYVGEWSIHVSWRLPGEKEWRGSWYHGTSDTSLKLSALRPAEWRVRVRQGRNDEFRRIRAVTVAEGETKVVDL